MPPKKEIPGSPADWLIRAKSDLAIAKAPLPEGAFYEDLCFHAQQAAEKALKAAYRAYGLTFRYTHDLAELLMGLKGKGIEIPAELEEASELSGFAWEARYPGTEESLTEEEYRQAIALAERVLAWAERLVASL